MIPITPGMIGAGAGAISALMGGDKSDEAADAMYGASKKAQQMMQAEMGRARQLEGLRLEAAQAKMNPYVESGQAAQNQLLAQMGMGGKAFDVTQLPGYQQALEMGLGAVNQGAAGSGMLMSGSRLKGLQKAGQNVFGQYYGDYMNRLQNMAARGQQAAGTYGGWGIQSGQNLTGNMLNATQSMMGAQQAMGQAQASGLLGQRSTIGEVGNMLGQMGGMMAGQFGGGGAAPAASPLANTGYSDAFTDPNRAGYVSDPEFSDMERELF